MNRVLANRFYYLENFETVLHWIEQRHNDLLAQPERDFITRFLMLPRPSRALLVRMIMRKGTLFRSGKLRYDEVGDSTVAALTLVDQGWLDDHPAVTIEELFSLLTKAEISNIFAASLPNKNLKKTEQLIILGAQSTEARQFGDWWDGAAEPVYRLLIMPLCERFRLMFFGNLRQDWSEFVLADLGLYAYEKVDFAPDSRVFRTRRDIDDYLHLHDCRERFRAGASPELVMEELPSLPYQNEWLEQRRAKLLFQIAQHYEKAGDWLNALDAYSSCGHIGARLRTIRVLERSGQFEPALALARIARRQPESETESQRLNRIVPRLERRLIGHIAPRERMAPIARLTIALPKPPTVVAVEELAREHLQRQSHGTVHYVENALINALFGLLCWESIFAAIPGAFFHPFQRGPADLYSADFYQRRKTRFSACLAQLESGQYKQTIFRNFKEKAGIRSTFVAWEVISEEILKQALSCIPATHLKKCFERMLLDVASNRSGFPDLIQFWPFEKRYRMIEVKGPGDRLQDNQLRWLDYCAVNDMPAVVCHVQWAQAAS
jgi:hypothetical protein